MNNQLIFPLGFYIFYIFGLVVYLFKTRVQEIRNGQVSADYFKAYLGKPPTDRAVVVGRHYDNQFQVPMLFFVTVILHFSMGHVNSLTILLAWAFVVTRLIHSWIHLGSNKPQNRVLPFAAGWIILLLLWIQLLYFAI